MAWQANVFTIFPEAFPGNLGVSLIGEALSQKKWELNLVDLKKYPVKSDRIDSIPYGGGAGMVLSPVSFEKAFESLSANQKAMKRIYCSPRGRQMNQLDMQQLSVSEGIMVLCGRYEGVDQRILDYYNFEEISIGDFVLMGGEVVAMTIIEGIVRLLPEVVGNKESLRTDSFQEQLLEHDQYTRPREFKGLEVPEILRSGNHEEIRKFRLNQSIEITKKRRPDVWAKYMSEKLKNLDSV